MGNIGTRSRHYDVLPVGQLTADVLSAGELTGTDPSPSVPMPEPMPAPYPDPVPEPAPTPAPDPTMRHAAPATAG